MKIAFIFLIHNLLTTLIVLFTLLIFLPEFPAGILQGAFFSNDRPRYMNYGAIGFVMGHEITHGFDDQGRQFDKEGNLVEWWQEETKEKYLKRAECIIHQYGNYTASEVDLKVSYTFLADVKDI